MSRSRNDHRLCASTTWLHDRFRLIVARRCFSVRDWQKHAHLRDKRTYEHTTLRTKGEKKLNTKRCKFTLFNTTRLVQSFLTNVRNTNLLGVNSKDLSESFCLIVTKFFFTTTSLSSLIWYVFMFLSLWSVANWRWAMLLTVLMVGMEFGRREGTKVHFAVHQRLTYRNGMIGISYIMQMPVFQHEVDWQVACACLVPGVNESEFKWQEGFWARWAGLREPRRPIGKVGFEIQGQVGNLVLFCQCWLLTDSSLPATFYSDRFRGSVHDFWLSFKKCNGLHP